MSFSALTFDFPKTAVDWVVLLGLLAAIWVLLTIGAGPLAGTLGALVGLLGYGVDRHTYIALSMLTVGILLCGSRRDNPKLTRAQYLFPQIVIVAAGWTLYEFSRDITEGPRDLAISNSLRVLDLEQRLSLHIEPTFQGWIMESDRAVSIASRLYSSLYLPFIVGTLVWFLLTDEMSI